MNDDFKKNEASNPCYNAIATEIAMGKVEVLIFNDCQFPIRHGDGYWSATAMCQAYEKKVNVFLRSDSTQGYLQALSKKLNLPIEADNGEPALVFKSKGGQVGQSGTWVHQQIALKLAAWLNPDLEVWVWEVIEKLFVQGQVKLSDELESLGQALKLTRQQLETLDIEYAKLEKRCDQLNYENDELADMAQWRRFNCFAGRDG